MNELDLLVLGSGVAGLSAAVRAAEAGLSVGVLTKGELEQATTRWAQGGVAAALSLDPEELDLHLADTLAAGAGLCDPAAVRVLVDEGPRRVQELIALGAVFDMDEAGEFQLAREGGHSVPRILHAGGAATGREVERALVHAVKATAAAIHEQAFATDLVLSPDGSQVVGVTALNADGVSIEVAARNVLLATGGAGQLFWITTNPRVATGDGVAMAMRAGAVVADFEFFQFHPTALALPSMPRPLLSEALRGHGALLLDRHGDRFVDELKPRDVVSRAMTRTMLDQDVDHLWLDATVLDDFASRFPSIAADLTAAGLDPAKDWLPVAPAAHHQCGGILTDLDGATSLPGLWAAGETASTGVHGANRLASNSLLEGLVFSRRIATVLPAELRSWSEPVTDTRTAGLVAGSTRRDVQEVMSSRVGVLRNAAGLEEADTLLDKLSGVAADAVDLESWETTNLLTISGALADAALLREETRGSHWREDFPERDDARWAGHFDVTLRDGATSCTFAPAPATDLLLDPLPES